MTDIKRKAGAIWNGDLDRQWQDQYGKPDTFRKDLYKKNTRSMEETSGTNPEELIAAAHAACFSMALASTLKKNGFEPKQTDTTATCSL